MKKQKTFLTYEKPLLTAMVQAEAPQECKDIILNSLWDGAEALAGEYRACMQLEWTGTKEPLSDGTDSRFHKADLWILLLEEKWNKKTAKKYIFWIVSQLWTATNENRRYKSGAA